MGSGKLVHRAIKKYGLENFSKEILFVFLTEEEMNAKEKELVIVSEETYNLCEGGQGGFGYINKNNIKNYKLNLINTNKTIYEKYGVYNASQIDYVKNKTSERTKKLHLIGFFPKPPSWLNKFHTEKSKNKIGQANSIKQQGSKNSQYGTCWITNGQENKKIKKEDVDKWIELGYTRGRKTILTLTTI